MLCPGTTIEEIGRGTSKNKFLGGRIVRPIAPDILKDVRRMSRHPRVKEDNLRCLGRWFRDRYIVPDEVLWAGKV